MFTRVSCIVFCALTLTHGEDSAAMRKALIRSLAAGDDALGKVTLTELVEATAGKKVLPFDTEQDPVCKRIAAAVKNALTTALEQANSKSSPLKKKSRINETSRFFEDTVRDLLNSTPGFSCDFPKTTEGKEQRSGYPDLRLVHNESGRVAYLDPKVYAEDSESSSFRTFYFEPSEGNGKIHDDAHHLILGISHNGDTGHWTFTGWKIVDVCNLPLQLKAEFNASNRELYGNDTVKMKSAE